MSLFNLSEVGNRLREERKRLGFNRQADMAAALKLPERTYWDREAGNVPPDAEFFARFCELGGNALYVITGQRETPKVMQIRSGYSPATRLANGICELNLTEEDADMLLALAERLSIKSK